MSRLERLQSALTKQQGLLTQAKNQPDDIVIQKVLEKLNHDIKQLEKQIALEQERASVTQQDLDLLKANGLRYDPSGRDGFTKAELGILKGYTKSKRDAIIKLFQ